MFHVSKVDKSWQFFPDLRSTEGGYMQHYSKLVFIWIWENVKLEKMHV